MKYPIARLFNTIKYLKVQQIYYRIYYLIRKKFFAVDSDVKYEKKTVKLKLDIFINAVNSYFSDKFTFLNISHSFEDKIDWNYNKYGKLWTYNLTYFDFLNQKYISKDEGLFLVHDFVSNIDEIKDGMEPFPISLRGMNWIKFLSKYDIKDNAIDNSLYAQYMNLANHLEYHLLGNHLLENAFSLLFGAYYFQDERLYTQSKKLLLKELDEQILEDGTHFELSPMYHQIMLFRVLDCINLVSNNNWKSDDLLSFLTKKAEIMLAWLREMTFTNGSIPLFNDSTNNIAPKTVELKDYASRLGLQKGDVILSASGYRKFVGTHYELVVDVGNIGPDYIPGHAHSDTFNFELYIKNSPFIVDTGLSTYETNVRRTLERSTQSHNTVMINNINQSDVWGGFRVAKRAKIINIKEDKNFVEATHDGYESNLGVLHTRSFTAFKDKIVIEDTIIGDANAVAYLHLYPGMEPVVGVQQVKVGDIVIKISSDMIEIKEYEYAPEFNKLIKAKVIEIGFRKKLKMEIAI